MLLDRSKKDSEKCSEILEVTAMGPVSNSDGKPKGSASGNGTKKAQKSTEDVPTVEKKEKEERRAELSQEREKKLKEVMDKKEKDKVEKEAKRDKERRQKQLREKQREEKKEREKLEREERLMKEKKEKLERSKVKQSKSKQDKKDTKLTKTQPKKTRIVSSIEESPEEVEDTPKTVQMPSATPKTVSLSSPAPVPMPTAVSKSPEQCVYKKPKSYHTYVNISDLDHNIVVIREIISPKQRSLGAEPVVSSPIKGSTKSRDRSPITTAAEQDSRKKGVKQPKSKKGGSGCLLCMSRKGR